MKVTIKKLRNLRACDSGINWFTETFGDEVDLEVLLKKLIEEKNSDWLVWVYAAFYPTSKRALKKIIRIKKGYRIVTRGFLRPNDFYWSSYRFTFVKPVRGFLCSKKVCRHKLVIRKI